VDPALAARAAAAGGPHKMGIRPMYVDVRDHEIPGAIAGRVTNVEDQGYCRIVTISLGKVGMKARVKDDRTIPADACWVVLPPDKVRLFSGDRLVR
jgi:glycerol transport system ATP-binding protein